MNAGEDAVPAIVVKVVERMVDMVAGACRRTAGAAGHECVCPPVPCAARESERSESCSAFAFWEGVEALDQRRCVDAFFSAWNGRTL